MAHVRQPRTTVVNPAHGCSRDRNEEQDSGLRRSSVERNKEGDGFVRFWGERPREQDAVGGARLTIEIGTDWFSRTFDDRGAPILPRVPSTARFLGHLAPNASTFIESAGEPDFPIGITYPTNRLGILALLRVVGYFSYGRRTGGLRQPEAGSTPGTLGLLPHRELTAGLFPKSPDSPLYSRPQVAIILQSKIFLPIR